MWDFAKVDAVPKLGEGPAHLIRLIRGHTWQGGALPSLPKFRPFVVIVGSCVAFMWVCFYVGEAGRRAAKAVSVLG